MKVLLDFNLPDDKEYCEWALKSPELVNAVNEFKKYMRDELKYRSDDYTEEQRAVLQNLQERFFETLANYGVEEFF